MRNIAFLFLLLGLVPHSYAQLVRGRPPSLNQARFPASIIVEEGSTLTIECPTNRDTEIRWFRDEKDLDIRSRILFIGSVHRDHSGLYHCAASNMAGIVRSPMARVEILFLDGFDDTDGTAYQQTVAPGEWFSLLRPALKASPSVRPEFVWYHNDIQVKNDTTHQITSNGDLVVLDAGRKNFGSYKVHAVPDSSVLGEIVSRIYEVEEAAHREQDMSKLSIVYWEDERKLLAVEPPTMETFSCLPSMSKGVTLKWFLNGNPLMGDNGLVSIGNEGRMISIRSPTLFKEGVNRLECKASMRSGTLSDKKVATIKLAGKPSIISLPDTVHRELKSRLEGDCVLDGGASPQTSIVWYHEGKQISDNEKLVVSQLTENDFGVYQCEARNAAGSEISTVWVEEGPDDHIAIGNISDDLVWNSTRTDTLPRLLSSLDDRQSREKSRDVIAGPADFVLERPREVILTASPEDVVLPEGTPRHLLQCVASGHPQPKIKWTFDGSIINEQTNMDKYKLTPEGLVILDAARTDSGTYQCEASNSVDKMLAAAQVVVSGSALIKNPPTNQSILIGTTLEIPCEVNDEMAQQAHVQWSLNGRAISTKGDPSLRLTRRKNSLIIGQVGPDNIGEYKCTVKAAHMEESATMWLRIIEKPSMPTAVMASLVNDSVPARVRVTWHQGFDGNSPIIRHSIEMRSLGVGPSNLWSSWETVVENVQQCCEHMVDNLRPAATIQFRVVAANRHGRGKPSLPSGQITMPQQPPAAAPRNVAASARSSNAVVVQWQQPQEEQWSGDVLGYTIRYRLAGYNLDWQQMNISDKGARNAVLEQLITWREYEVQMAAFNHRGVGVFSRSVEVTTKEGIPSVWPSYLKVSPMNSTAAQISFHSPDQQLIPGVNLGYKIEFWKGEPQKSKLYKMELLEPLESDYDVVVDGLEKYGHYNVTVLVFTSAGDGPRSPPQVLVTHQDKPGAVSMLSIAEVLFDGSVVTWEEPREVNGVIVRYILRHWPESDLSDKTEVELPGDTLNYTISGLESKTKYGVDVVAATSVGTGPVQETNFESGIPPVLPDRPSSLHVTEVKARSVILKFTPGFDGNTAIRQWIVEAKVSESSIFQQVYNVSAPKATSLEVHGLRPYTKYQLRLIAENVKGRGAPSEPSQPFETKSTNPERLAGVLFAEPVSSTSLSLSWTPLQASQWNGQGSGYLITYKTSDQAQQRWREMRASSVRANEVVLNDLKPFTEYQVDVFAENDHGRSKGVGIVKARTYESTPSAAPQNVRADSEGHRTVTVKWDQLDEDSRNGEIKGYTVRFVPEKEHLREEASRTVDVPDASQLSVTVNELRAGTDFNVFVSAYTIVGPGPQNTVPVLAHTVQDVPGAPTDVKFISVATNEVKLTWKPPENCPSSSIKQYVVTYWESRRDRSTAIQAPTGSIMAFKADLKPDTFYTFTVAAENTVGMGPEAEVEVFSTIMREPLPTPPVPLRAEGMPYAPRNIALHWGQLTVRNTVSPVRYVEVEYQQANAADWTPLGKYVDANNEGVTVSRLRPNSLYHFRIRLCGDFSATSVWSAESEWMRTLAASPQQAPTKLDPVPQDSNSLKLDFSPPPKSMWNSDAVGYHIEYRVYPSNESWSTVEVPVSNAPESETVFYVINKLVSFRHYIVRVRAFNSEGEGPFSAPVFAYVGYSIPKRSIVNLIGEPTSSTSVSLRWDPWLEDDNDVISGFKVKYVAVASVLSEESTEEEIVVVENNTCIITDLHKFTQYQFSVAAYNRAGTGVPAALRVRTLEDTPGPVARLRFVDVLLDSVRVIWDAPLTPNGNVTKYTVRYRTHQSLGDYKQQVQSTVEHEFFLADGLREGQQYMFSVWAETAAGRGPESNGNVTLGPRPDGPAAPLIDRLQPGPASVTIKWTDQARKQDVVGHLIQAKRIAVIREMTREDNDNREKRSFALPDHTVGEFVTLKVVDGPGQSHEISYRDLVPASEYVFRVFARNEMGVGGASRESSVIKVPATLPEDPFYTAWWFIALVAMSIFVVIVLVIAFLCVTGSNDKYRRSKRNSVDSLQLADGNFIAFQMKNQQRNMNRSRTELTRPGTTQSWLSDREPPAYGSVTGAPGGRPEVNSRVDMYGGLATDYHPNMPSQEAMQRLSTLVGRDVGGTGSAYVSGRRRSSIDRAPRGDYMGARMDYGYANQDHHVGDYGSVGHGEVEDDSFDEDESVGGGGGPDVRDGGGLAAHYQSTDHYRETWRRVLDSEAIEGSAPHSPRGTGSVPSVESPNSQESWPSQRAPALASGFSSFV